MSSSNLDIVNKKPIHLQLPHLELWPPHALQWQCVAVLHPDGVPLVKTSRIARDEHFHPKSRPLQMGPPTRLANPGGVLCLSSLFGCHVHVPQKNRKTECLPDSKHGQSLGLEIMKHKARQMSSINIGWHHKFFSATN